MSPTRKPYLQEEVDALKGQIDRLDGIVSELYRIITSHQDSTAIDKYIREWRANHGADPDG